MYSKTKTKTHTKYITKNIMDMLTCQWKTLKRPPVQPHIMLGRLHSTFSNLTIYQNEKIISHKKGKLTYLTFTFSKFELVIKQTNKQWNTKM